MSCQACPQRATTEGVHGALRVRCCSERCGREIVGGIFPADTGYVCVVAASPLGRAIARETRQAADCRVPIHVAAQLVGALQRIGPKRAADDADLPASTQAAAPTGIDWIADIPPEVWTTSILPYLKPADLRAFAATSSESAMLVRTDIVQAEKYRQTRTPYQAALAYVSNSLPAEQRHVIRLAYPNVAELALARLLVFDIEQIYELKLPPVEYRRLIASLRTEAGRDGDELYARPIQVPIAPRTLILERRRVKSVNVVPAMARALVTYAHQHWSNTNNVIRDAFRSYMHVLAPPPNSPLESPTTPCFFSYPYMFNLRVYNPVMTRESLVELSASGVDLTRTDAGFWYAEMLSRTYNYLRVGHHIAEIFAAIESLRFDGQRTDGQMSLLYMTKKLQKSDMDFADLRRFPDLFMNFLRVRDCVGVELRAPVIMNGGGGNTILHLLCRTPANLPTVREVIVATLGHNTTVDGIANPPLLVRNDLGEIPIETMMSEAFAEPDNDDMLERITRILRDFGLWCHPFAQSIVHNKPIMAIAPVEYHHILVEAVAFATPSPSEWNTADVKQYLLYMATQVYENKIRLSVIALAFDRILRQFSHLGLLRTVVEPLRPLLTPYIKPSHRLYLWFV